MLAEALHGRNELLQFDNDFSVFGTVGVILLAFFVRSIFRSQTTEVGLIELKRVYENRYHFECLQSRPILLDWPVEAWVVRLVVIGQDLNRMKSVFRD